MTVFFIPWYAKKKYQLLSMEHIHRCEVPCLIFSLDDFEISVIVLLWLSCCFSFHCKTGQWPFPQLCLMFCCNNLLWTEHTVSPCYFSNMSSSYSLPTTNSALVRSPWKSLQGIFLPFWPLVRFRCFKWTLFWIGVYPLFCGPGSIFQPYRTEYLLEYSWFWESGYF